MDTAGAAEDTPKEAGMVKHYTNGEITVTWKPDLCHHSGICARGLPAVFDPGRRPWIELRHADTDTITSLVNRCPSGALTWARNSDSPGPGANDGVPPAG